MRSTTSPSTYGLTLHDAKSLFDLIENQVYFIPSFYADYIKQNPASRERLESLTQSFINTNIYLKTKENGKALSDKEEKEVEANLVKPTLITADYLLAYYEANLSKDEAEYTRVLGDEEKKLNALSDLVKNNIRFVDITKNDKEIYANMLSPKDFENFGGETMDEIIFSKNIDLYNKTDLFNNPIQKENVSDEISKRKKNIKTIRDNYYNKESDYDYAFSAMRSPYKALQKSLQRNIVPPKSQEELDSLYKKAINKPHKFKTFVHSASNILSAVADALDEALKVKEGKHSNIKDFFFKLARFAANAVLPISVSRKQSFFKGEGMLAGIGNFALSTAASLVLPGILVGLSFAFPPLAPVFLTTAAVCSVVFTIPALVKNIFNFTEKLHIQRQKLKTTEMLKGVDHSLEKELKNPEKKEFKGLSHLNTNHKPRHYSIIPDCPPTNLSEHYYSTVDSGSISRSRKESLKEVEIKKDAESKNIVKNFVKDTNKYAGTRSLLDTAGELSTLDTVAGKIKKRFKGVHEIVQITQEGNSYYLVTFKNPNQASCLVMNKSLVPEWNGKIDITIKPSDLHKKEVKHNIAFTIQNGAATVKEVPLQQQPQSTPRTI